MNQDMRHKCKMIKKEELRPFLEKLEKLFLSMIEKYDEAASYYGFHCHGCDDNCCMTLFHHHTYAEFFYLKEGMETLSSEIKRQVYHRAEEICRQNKQADKKTDSERTMCPANIDGKCVVYHHRPMICRLHGIPSQWSFPAKSGVNRTVVSSGCEEFGRQCKKKEYYQFDRTSFYKQVARLENQLKEHFGLDQKIKKTVAEIIVCEAPSINQSQLP
jgi:Fe-S-cluster containining protein